MGTIKRLDVPTESKIKTTLYLSKAMHKRLKVYCAANAVTHSRFLEDAIRIALKADKTKEGE